MRWSDERILTTHTGSLPRPPELTRLYVRRARGEAIDRAELDRVGKAALRRIVDKQIEAGIDIGNNGEQQREAFFLYVRHRMSGFGDSWQRWPRGDVERYPLLKQQMAQLPATQGDRRGAVRRRHRIEFGDCRFSRRARGEAGWVRRAIYDRSLARDHCRGNEERTLRQ